MEKKLAIASCNNPKELLNQRSEIMFVTIKKVAYLVDKLEFNFLVYFF